MQQLADSTIVNALTDYPLLTLAGVLAWCLIVFCIGAWLGRNQPTGDLKFGAFAFVAGGCGLAAFLLGFVVCNSGVQARATEQLDADFMQVSDDREELYDRIMEHISFIDQLEKRADNLSADSEFDEGSGLTVAQRWAELAAEFNQLQLLAEEQHARAIEVRSHDYRLSIVENTGKMKAELAKNYKRILAIGLELMSQPQLN